MYTCWESFKAEGSNVLLKGRALLHEGNVRRVVVTQRGRTVAEFPLTVGIAGAVFAPFLTAVGGAVALLQDCTITVERGSEPPSGRSSGEPSGPTPA